MAVNIPVVKYIFVVIATASASCVYPVIWPGREYVYYPLKELLLRGIFRTHPRSTWNNNGGVGDWND